MKEFNIGDLVLLTLDSTGTVGITDGLREYKDRKFRISRIKSVPSGTQSGALSTYYELKGCASDMGVPYAVTADWMVPMKELKR